MSIFLSLFVIPARWQDFSAGKEEIFQHSIQLNAEYYTPVDGELIPTGEIHSVANTEFDLRVPKMMGDIIGSKIFYTGCLITQRYKVNGYEG